MLHMVDRITRSSLSSPILPNCEGSSVINVPWTYSLQRRLPCRPHVDFIASCAFQYGDPVQYTVGMPEWGII